MSWSEDRLHRWLARGASPRGLVGSRGHDAAVLGGFEGHVVACVDACIEGRHFVREAGARAIGRKAVLRCLCDLAATASRPRAVLVSLSAPARETDAFLRSILTHARAAAREHGADLVGGDLSSHASGLHLVVTALGDVTTKRTPIGRDRARVGDLVLVTGPLGGSRLGRHLEPAPRFQEAHALATLGARAMMDVSDGLAFDLHRLARSAGVGIELELERVPIHRDAVRCARQDGVAALTHALNDGEDHELLITIPRATWRREERTLVRRFPALVAIGSVVRGRGLWLASGTRRRRWQTSEGGWQHGGGDEAHDAG